MQQRETSAQIRKRGRSTVLGKGMFLGYILNMSLGRVSVGEEGEGHSSTWTENAKGTGTNSGVAESISSRAETTRVGGRGGGAVKLKSHRDKTEQRP